MKRRLLKTLVWTLIITLIGAGFIFYAMYVAPENIKTTHKSITSEKISESLHDVNIAYISDINYGEFVDESRFKAMIETINNASPDIVLFGGDLFTDPDKIAANPEVVQMITDQLKSIEAPLGKFYVLGDCDVKSESGKTIVSNILYNAGFENLTNRNLKIHNGTSDSFNLVGIDSLIGGTPDIQSAYANISNTSFTIAFTHAPDIYADIPEDSTDLAFAGHSHGGQISLPIIGSLTSIEGAQKYESGTYQVKNLTIDISNGLGTTNVDMRLFSPPEVLIYRLVKK